MGQTRLRIAIVGGGIGGLMFAISLGKFCKDISVDIYEAQDQLAEVGAGIGTSGRIWQLMQILGLHDDLMAVGSTESANVIQFRKGDQKVGIDFQNPTPPQHLQTFHRSDFLKVLSDHLPSGFKIHFSKRLETYAYAKSGDVTLHFHDGLTATANLIVGYDGIRSAVRTTLYHGMAEEAERVGQAEAAAKASSHIVPKYSGTSAYRSLIPTEKLLKRYPGHPGAAKAILRFGKNKVRPLRSVCEEQLDLLHVVRLWEEETKALVECMDKVSLWALNVVPDLPTYIGDRVALLGDAAHAMVPHHGSGAGQAFEDGYLLAGLLAKPETAPSNLNLALHLYDKFRRPLSQKVQRESRRSGLLYEFNAAGCEGVMEEESAAGGIPKEKLDEIASEIAESMSWMTSSSIIDDTKEAVGMLESELARLHTLTVAEA